MVRDKAGTPSAIATRISTKASTEAAPDLEIFCFAASFKALSAEFKAFGSTAAVGLGERAGALAGLIVGEGEMLERTVGEGFTKADIAPEGTEPEGTEPEDALGSELRAEFGDRCPHKIPPIVKIARSGSANQIRRLRNKSKLCPFI